MSGTARAVKALRDMADPSHHGDTGAVVAEHAGALGFAGWATCDDVANAMSHVCHDRAECHVRAELSSVDAPGRWGVLAAVVELARATALSVDARDRPRPGGPGAVVLAMARAGRLPPEDDGRRWNILITDRASAGGCGASEALPCGAPVTSVPPNADVVIALDASEQLEAAWAPACQWHERFGPILVAQPNLK